MFTLVERKRHRWKKRTYSSGKRIGKKNSRLVSVLPIATYAKEATKYPCGDVAVPQLPALSVGRAGQAFWGCLFSPPAWNLLQVLNSRSPIPFWLNFYTRNYRWSNLWLLVFLLCGQGPSIHSNMFLYLFYYGGQLAASPNSPGQLIISTSITIS